MLMAAFSKRYPSVTQAKIIVDPVELAKAEEKARKQAERDAEKEVENIVLESDALVSARGLSIEQLEMLTRVIFGKDPALFTTGELKRDILVFAKKDPKEFIKLLADPELNIQSRVRAFFSSNLLSFRNNEKEVWFNTPTNKKKMLTVPFGEDPYFTVSTYFKTDDGIVSLKFLENCIS